MTEPNADLDLPATAALLDLPEQTLLRWAEKGALPSRGSNGSMRFQRNDVIEWARSMGMRVAATRDHDAETLEPNLLAAALRRGAIVQGIVGKAPATAIEDLVARMPGLDNLGIRGLQKDELLTRILAREQLASTAIGHGFAVPHARSPLNHHLDDCVVVLGRLQHAIDWRAIDGRAVDTVLLVLSNRLEKQLEVLRRIALALRHADVRSIVRESDDLGFLCDAIEAIRE